MAARKQTARKGTRTRAAGEAGTPTLLRPAGGPRGEGTTVLRPARPRGIIDGAGSEERTARPPRAERAPRATRREPSATTESPAAAPTTSNISEG